MRALEVTKHKTILTNILIEIYKNSFLAPFLGFKGGTAAMLFYGLPRFSVDLDFDLTGKFDKDSPELSMIIEKITQLLSTKYTIKDQSAKYNTLFWLISYGSGFAQVKIEVSTRDISDNHYNIMPFYGISVKVLDIKDMIAHKLIAAINRKSPANRDLFDCHFFLSSQFAGQINYEIINNKTGETGKEYYTHLQKYLESINQKNILSGLGELLSEKQKYWVKNKLLDELKGLAQRQIDII